MMSGAYVLTDTIDKAFNAIFAESYGTDGIVSGKRAPISASRVRRRSRLRSRRTSSSGSERSTGSRSTGSVTDPQIKRRPLDGESIDTGGSTSFAFASRPRPRVRALQSAQPRRGSLAVGLGGGRDRRGSRRGREPRRERPDRRRGLGPARVRDRRGREVRRCEFAWRRHVRHLRVRPPRRSSTRRASLDAAGRRAGRGSRPRSSSPASVKSLRYVRDGAVRNRAGERGVGRGGDVHEHHPVLPAVVRGHRPVRRRLRDLQHALGSRSRSGRASSRRCERSARLAGRCWAPWSWRRW